MRIETCFESHVFSDILNYQNKFFKSDFFKSEDVCEKTGTFSYSEETGSYRDILDVDMFGNWRYLRK